MRSIFLRKEFCFSGLIGSARISARLIPDEVYLAPRTIGQARAARLAYCFAQRQAKVAEFLCENGAQRLTQKGRCF